MKRTHLLTGALAAAGMLVFILDGKTALAGAQMGLDLCIRTVIPSLFPFFLLSIHMTASFSGHTYAVFRPLERILGMPSGSGIILIPGFLGGYPAGAQCVASAYARGSLAKKDAEQMLHFCSNAGPAFLFGMVSSVFPHPSYGLLLWAIHVGSAGLTAILTSDVPSGNACIAEKKEPSLSKSMDDSIHIMAVVCGWIILFRVLIGVLEKWFLWMLPTTLQVIAAGLLELSNGCIELQRISDPDLRFIVCSCLLAFGGMCVTMQTGSAIKGLSITPYLKGKLIQTMISFVLSVSVILHIWIPVLTLLLLSAVIIQKVQKRSRNPASLVV